MTPEEIIDWIWSRCREDGDCLIWTGCTDPCGVPKMRLRGDPRGKVRQTRRTLMEAMGINIAGRIATTTCGNPRCMAEGHIASYTRQQLQRRSGKVSAGNVARSAKLAVLARRRSRLTMDQVREIRAQGLNANQVMALTGLSESAAHCLVAGRTWKDYTSPFAQLMK